MLPAISAKLSGIFTFQQDGAPAHRAQETAAAVADPAMGGPGGRLPQ